MVAVSHEELADEQHQYETRKHNREGGKKAAQNTPIGCIAGIDNRCIANVCCAIDTNRARSTLADGNNIGELSHLHPMIMSYHLTLYHRKHGIAPTKAEKPDKEKGSEELQKKGYHVSEE